MPAEVGWCRNSTGVCPLLCRKQAQGNKMKRLLLASIVLAMAAPAVAQPTRTPPQTRTTDPDATITESQKGEPAAKESVPGAGGQQAGERLYRLKLQVYLPFDRPFAGMTDGLLCHG